jgi:hypothetical protein
MLIRLKKVVDSSLMLEYTNGDEINKTRLSRDVYLRKKDQYAAYYVT